MTENIVAPFGFCPTHGVPCITTKSGSATLCPRPDCDHVVQHPTVVQESPMSKSSKKNEMTPEERKRMIDEAVAKKKANGDPPKGSKAEKMANATKPGIVKPSKPAKVKIPKEKNLTSPQDEADAELDEKVKPKKSKKKEKDPNMLSVSDVAREIGLDPKRARAKLRAAEDDAPVQIEEGRWPLVKRDSKEHKALIALLAPPPADEEDEDEDEEEENEEENENENEEEENEEDEEDDDE